MNRRAFLVLVVSGRPFSPVPSPALELQRLFAGDRTRLLTLNDSRENEHVRQGTPVKRLPHRPGNDDRARRRLPRALHRQRLLVGPSQAGDRAGRSWPDFRPLAKRSSVRRSAASGMGRDPPRLSSHMVTSIMSAPSASWRSTGMCPSTRTGWRPHFSPDGPITRRPTAVGGARWPVWPPGSSRGARSISDRGSSSYPRTGPYPGCPAGVGSTRRVTARTRLLFSGRGPHPDRGRRFRDHEIGSFWAATTRLQEVGGRRPTSRSIGKHPALRSAPSRASSPTWPGRGTASRCPASCCAGSERAGAELRRCDAQPRPLRAPAGARRRGRRLQSAAAEVRSAAVSLLGAGVLAVVGTKVRRSRAGNSPWRSAAPQLGDEARRGRAVPGTAVVVPPGWVTCRPAAPARCSSSSRDQRRAGNDASWTLRPRTEYS